MGRVLISQDEDTFTQSSCEFCQDIHKRMGYVYCKNSRAEKHVKGR